MGNVSIFSIGRFEWLKNVDKFDLKKVTKVSSKSYILEVDLEYP